MKVYTDSSKAKEIKVGDVVAVHNTSATVVKIRPFGTIDVETASGKRFRVSGLAF